jgi:hypothetical protein
MDDRGQGPTGVEDNARVVPRSYPSFARPVSGKAIAAFVMSLLWVGGIGSIVAIFLAVSALKDVRRGTHSGHGLAMAGLILGILGILAVVVVIFVEITLAGADLRDQFQQVATSV